MKKNNNNKKANIIETYEKYLIKYLPIRYKAEINRNKNPKEHGIFLAQETLNKLGSVL